MATLFLPMTFAGEAALFAAMTVATTFLGRRYLTGPVKSAADINDSLDRLIGRRGEASSLFQSGQGRVFVDGKEWSAETDGEAAVKPGDRVEVVAVLGGARLKVRAG